jgi:hypothetical protein
MIQVLQDAGKYSRGQAMLHHSQVTQVEILILCQVVQAETIGPYPEARYDNFKKTPRRNRGVEAWLRFHAWRAAIVGLALG